MIFFKKIRKNSGWQSVLRELECAAVFSEKNFKNNRLPALFYLHFTNNGYNNVCVALRGRLGSRVEEVFISAKR
jgi:hypothetical protein